MYVRQLAAELNPSALGEPWINVIARLQCPVCGECCVVPFSGIIASFNGEKMDELEIDRLVVHFQQMFLEMCNLNEVLTGEKGKRLSATCAGCGVSSYWTLNDKRISLSHLLVQLRGWLGLLVWHSKAEEKSATAVAH